MLEKVAALLQFLGPSPCRVRKQAKAGPLLWLGKLEGSHGGQAAPDLLSAEGKSAVGVRLGPSEAALLPAASVRVRACLLGTKGILPGLIKPFGEAILGGLVHSLHPTCAWPRAEGVRACFCCAEEGHVFVWGYGILGKGPNLMETATPERIPPTLFGLSDLNPGVGVIRIVCGLSHFAAITSKLHRLNALLTEKCATPVRCAEPGKRYGLLFLTLCIVLRLCGGCTE